MKSFRAVKSNLLKDERVTKVYQELEPEFTVIQKLIEYRIRHGITQSELAKKLNTKQAAISRFESGTYNPSLQFLYKLSDALGATLDVKVS